jgi:hypothetical protein
MDRSRSRERLRRDREAKERLAEESKDHFYYSSVRWGQGSNMPKLGSIVDQSRIKFSDLVIACNEKNQDQLPTLQGIVTLGKEWRYYKKEIDQEKRKLKKQAEREAERSQSMRNDFRGRGSMLGKRDSKRW